MQGHEKNINGRVIEARNGVKTNTKKGEKIQKRNHK